MTGDSAAEVPANRSQWDIRAVLAWAPPIAACVLLLGSVRYAPTYYAGKITLLQAWVNTYWGDLWGYITGTSERTLSGETVASQWNYCALVPFIVAWLLWRMWPQLRETPLAPHRSGYVILAIGLVLYTLGFLTENYYVGFGSLEFVYAGLIVVYAGWTVMRQLIFPWAFVMFMWPYDFMEDVAATLRRYMAGTSHYFLAFIGVQNVLQGTAILSPHDAAHPFAIDIADPCSGIRSLFALVMIAAVYAAVAFEKIWQQIIIVIAAVPLVFVGNLVRIVLLTLATIHYGEAFALGNNEHPSTFHEFAGFLVYGVNFGCLILLGTFLSRFNPPEPEPEPAESTDPADSDHARS